MDLGAVRDASARNLACGAVAAARNARGLVDDAELLAGAGRLARAYSLAGLAVEEVGKAGGLAALSAMPRSLRAQVPVGRLLAWHQLKLVKGMLIAAVPFDATKLGTRFAPISPCDLAEILDDAQVFAQDADRLKQRGLYVDVDRSGHVREPSEVTADEVREQLDRARQASEATEALLDPSAPARLAHPEAAAVEASRALVSALAHAGTARTAEAAAYLLLNAIEFQGEMTAVGNDSKRIAHVFESCREAGTSPALVAYPKQDIRGTFLRQWRSGA